MGRALVLRLLESSKGSGMTGLSVTAVILTLCFSVLDAPASAQDNPQPEKPGVTTEPSKPETAQPAKPMAVPPAVDPSYTLGPDDVIFVKVWREPDLSGAMAIRPDGKITMPVINEVKASGLTPTQLGEEISKALSTYVKNPQVMVSVSAVRSKRYFMSGEINRPGAYPLGSPTTIFEALTMAGGFREFANKKKVTIIRGPKRYRFNWNEVIKGKNLQQNIHLESGDQVIVP
jgi:polysaccharide biosynthesis/export protein